MKNNEQNSSRKSKTDHSLWISLLIVFLILWGGFSVFKSEMERKEKERKEYLRENFSRMSTDPEIQEAYDEID